MRNQSHLNSLSMFPQRRRITPLAWSPCSRAVRDHAIETAKILAPYAAIHSGVSRLGIEARAYKTVSDQSISLIGSRLGHAGLAQSLIVAICAHIAAKWVHIAHEGD